MNNYELPTSFSGGQCALFIDFSQVKSRSVADTLSLLEQMGHQPQLRYLETSDGIQLYALLKFEQLDPNEPIPEDYWIDEVSKLWEAFPAEPLAVRYTRGVPAESRVIV